MGDEERRRRRGRRSKNTTTTSAMRSMNDSCTRWERRLMGNGGKIGGKMTMKQRGRTKVEMGRNFKRHEFEIERQIGEGGGGHLKSTTSIQKDVGGPRLRFDDEERRRRRRRRSKNTTTTSAMRSMNDSCTRWERR